MQFVVKVLQTTNTRTHVDVLDEVALVSVLANCTRCT